MPSSKYTVGTVPAVWQFWKEPMLFHGMKQYPQLHIPV
ncbi:hypothetical protein CLV40_108132 [Actinokineospora auranticolor]|uniref:Uncharacterized protein n=1 Tax=Actinokineospora auranticolor TaxID=155976 RepID=A0A2S6GPF8_9PSEU|nr:hypothetical protein CLV40_108132 [Actinokineospora auranticolor]